ncbi:S-layer homology domain-containing protein [Brevibacillus laterosporus]|uniref:S-layer homology domain-containing protein n=1 Tax=Brevibacillus laterosporus TaxID=1465 RepID=UPI002E1A7F0E|nr:S-layer homology domain-containing protein [Brevibacillus laterosporus]
MTSAKESSCSRIWWKVIPAAVAIVMATGVFLEPVQAEEIGDDLSAPLPFIDISNHPAKEAIVRAYEEGLFSDSSKAIQQFFPDKAMTRAEFFLLTSRFLQNNQNKLFPLTLLEENDEFGRGQGMDEPYLPYKDVHYMTWMYPGILRVFVYHDRIAGARTLHKVFPGDEFYPNQPITNAEAAKVLSALSFTTKQSPWELELIKKGSNTLTRAEAAILIEKVSASLQSEMLLPLADESRSLYPFVPVQKEMYPLFTTYDSPTETEKKFIDIVDAIKNYLEEEETFKELEELPADFANQVGVHYYKSWNYYKEPADNATEAFLALDAYIKTVEHDPKILGLLTANIYDVGLQMLRTNQGKEFEDLYQKLLGYESKLVKNSEEWKVFGLYLAAIEIHLDKYELAIKRYEERPDLVLAVQNGLYYLVKENRISDAENLLKRAKEADQKSELVALYDQVAHELDLLSSTRQNLYATLLSKADKKMDEAQRIIVKTEMNYGGTVLKVTEEMDTQRGITHTKGIYQKADQAVLNKMEGYTDRRNQVKYDWDNEKGVWTKKVTGSPTEKKTYLHEYVSDLPVLSRLNKLHARYLKQSFGAYEIITEFYEPNELQKYAETLDLQEKKLLYAPTFVVKYYLDSRTNQLLRQSWKITEIYDNGEYIKLDGDEEYEFPESLRLDIPKEVTEGAGVIHET